MIEDNPFFVLGLAADTSRIEIEREAQKLLGMLELGFVEAKTYQTPLGSRPRTPELVRAAVAALRDPYRRLIAELWARHAPSPQPVETAAAEPPQGGPSPQGGSGPQDAGRNRSDRLEPEPARAGIRRALGWGP